MKYHQTSSLYKLKGKGGSYRATIIQENIIETFLEQLNIKCNSLNINVMCKFQKFIGEITNYTNNVYTITVGDKSVTIPYSVMHKYPVFPTSMMESGHLKIGGNIHLVKRMSKHSILTTRPMVLVIHRNKYTMWMAPIYSRMQNH